ncbi:flagellar hook protein FlgE [Chromobacterium sp. IIBBL 290-4]|uniref:flagellar hook protein FlgE n=1 Tax=Chromobacterium sp. IIBBL 290-4 TaxID=2953890 RepID=UPI0020B89DAE|nr:flagellar hook protein FlgE [Chromobacterium sp. IIBBL 290-4]UTH73844.1 flagellar hook protein FlgE [Chromobacterium sp. IIBBL 290-4]
MGFEQGLSGINAASTQLDSIGNNVANANTVGFKSSRTEFGDLYGQSIFGNAANSPGNGVSVLAVTANMQSGNTENTGRSLDVAIGGSGFFVMKQPSGTQTYSRDGQFQVNSQGYLVNNSGAFVQGYGVNAAGSPQVGPLQNLQITNTSIAPQATTQMTWPVQLNSNSTTPTVSPVSPTNPSTYNYPATTTVYDTLGNSHQMTVYYSLTTTSANGNTWTGVPYVDGQPATVAGGGNGGGGNSTFTMQFNTSGQITGTTPANISVSFSPTNGSAAPETIALSLTGSTQIAMSSPGSNGPIVQNGAAPGTLTGVTITSSGVVQASFSNSQTKTLGQVALATFVNPQGMLNLGGNQWQQSGNSGTPTINQPGAGNSGNLISGSVEDSNVNLTNELVNMITAQRYYQANAQTIKTQDTLIQTLLNI